AAREALRQAPSEEYRALASSSIAYILEETGHLDQAADAYAGFIRDFPDHFLTARAYAQLGRLQASLGRAKEAPATLEKLISLSPATIWARDAKVALEALIGPPAPR